MDLDSPVTQRSRLPQLALGVLVVAACGLAGLWFYSSATDFDEVIALRSDIDRGTTISLDDLMVVQLNTDDVVTTLGKFDAEAIVGRVALTDLEAGTLVTPAQFTAEAVLEPGQGVVGLELGVGQVPTRRLLPGTVVSVVLTPRTGSTDPLIDGGAAQITELLVTDAVVVESSPVGTQGRQFVALVMDQDQAATVAVAASQDRVQLVQVAEQ